MNEIDGSCHCGRIRFRFRSRRTPAEFQLRECDCGYCTRIRGIYASDPHGELNVQIAGRVTPYRFGTKTAEFYACAGCGIMPLVVSRIQDRDYAVVNARCAEGFAPFLGSAKPMSYGAETAEARLARRRRHWIPAVRSPS
ncbi:MAG: hypothetical protein HYY48_05410 [Gammaproteobacteria bacterium]|nr:hypothetical protein [Gammaproteobacteria bacterium]